MRTDCVTGTDFQGRIVITNKFSSKPEQSVNKIQNELENIVKKDNYVLCLTQDYSTDTINFNLKQSYYPNLNQKEELADTGIINKISINSNASKYVETAKKTIDDYKALQQQRWGKNQNEQSLKDIGEFCASFALLPIAIIVGGIVEGTKDISKEFKNMFNKAKKFAIKKG